MRVVICLAVLAVALTSGCCSRAESEGNGAAASSGRESGTLPQPYATPAAEKWAKLVGWPPNVAPSAPGGLTVSIFAKDLDGPRWLYVLPNGDVLVAESRGELKPGRDAETAAKLTQSGLYGKSANRITLLRDANGDGKPEVRKVFVSGIQQPLGMLVLNGLFYVAGTDALWRYPYRQGAVAVSGGTRILDLPAGGYNNHWTRNLVAKPDGSRIYLSVGSGSNVGENGMASEVRRANILEINPDGSGESVYAAGLRNPVGMDWEPQSGTLWTAVNERDGLGDDLVPDYMTSVDRGSFYGWPYAYYGPNEDPRRKGERPDLVAKSVAPDFELGSHTASLGLLFYRGESLPERYRNGAFVSQHGSWNRSKLAGYKVVFVPFSGGKPSGAMEDFLTGFIRNEETAEVNGRPVGLAVMADGSLLVADDAAGVIWRVSNSKQSAGK